MASVSVRVEGNVIHAIFNGAMTVDLVREAEQQIEAALDRTSYPVVLYDTLAMHAPSMKLALELKAFDARVKTRVVRSATVVCDSATAFMAKVAFVLAREHRVFYDDINAAHAWLEGKPVPLSAAPFADGHSRSHRIR